MMFICLLVCICEKFSHRWIRLSLYKGYEVVVTPQIIVPLMRGSILTSLQTPLDHVAM
jgi:hypothetical protein